ncbi:MAG: hypothetical protein M1832_004608, partial [Thelocarpon impressellum]
MVLGRPQQGPVGGEPPAVASHRTGSSSPLPFPMPTLQGAHRYRGRPGTGAACPPPLDDGSGDARSTTTLLVAVEAWARTHARTPARPRHGRPNAWPCFFLAFFRAARSPSRAPRSP